MKALLLRDRSFALVFAVFGAIGLCIALVQDRFAEVWVFPTRNAEATFHVGWASGLLLGAFAALRDQLFGMRDYVRHRPLSPARLHAGRLATCGLVLLAWWTLAPAGAWATEWLAGDLAAVGSLGNYPDVLATMLPAATGTAIGLFAASLPCGYVLRLVVAAAMLFVGFPGIDLLAAADGDRAMLVRGPYVAMHLAWTAVLVAASFAAATHDRDLDRPWVRRIGFPAAGVAVLATVLFGTMVLGSMAIVQFQRLARTFPVVADLGDRHVLALRQGQWPNMQYQIVDAAHQPVDEAVPHRHVRSDSLASGRWVGRDPELRRPDFHASDYGTARLGEDGLLRWLLREFATGQVRWLVLGKGDDRSAFGPGTRVLTLDSDDRNTWSNRIEALWVVEPGAREVWRLDMAAGRLVAVPLPDGDRVVDCFGIDREGGRIAPSVNQGQCLVRGERGAWWIGKTALRDVDTDVVATVDARRARQEQSPRGMQWVDADVLTPTVQLRREDGSVALEHAFVPRRSVEHVQFALALTFSLLRPPLLQVPIHVAGEVAPRGLPIMLDPVVAGGRRSWLVLAGCTLAAIAAFRARQRLRALGADARTLWFWTVFVALTGPIGLLCCVLCETRRAWAMPAEASAPPPPRIVTRVA